MIVQRRVSLPSWHTNNFVSCCERSGIGHFPRKWREKNGNRIFYPSNKECFTSLFDFPPRRSVPGLEFALEWWA
jgi:hypothetical protein